MDNHESVKINQDCIQQANIVCGVFHLQENYNQYVIAAVEIDKQVYFFSQHPYQYNADCIEAFKAHLKVRKDHNDSLVYNPGLVADAVLEIHKITKDAASEEKRINFNIKSKEIFLTCLFLIGANHIIKKQLNNELKFYIMVINGYPQELPGVMKLIN